MAFFGLPQTGPYGSEVEVTTNMTPKAWTTQAEPTLESNPSIHTRCGVEFRVDPARQPEKGASMSEHAKVLEPKIQKIHDRLKKLAADDRLLQIIQRPGFTTKRESEFVHAMLDSVGHHLEGIERAHTALITIADQIGR
jgi:hypothetical protein